MADLDRSRWTKLVADFESCDLTQREFATERASSPAQQSAVLDVPSAQGVAPARLAGAGAFRSSL